MIRFDVVHGSPEWGILRMGRPTSSDFEKIITPTGRLSAQADAYENKLIAEIMLKEPVRTLEPTFWMERGSIMELEAAESYEFIHDTQTERGGFIMDDAKRFGCSPDRYIPDTNGGLEIKCPAPHTHVNYLINGTDEKYIKKYKPQYQAQMFIAGFDYVDMFSFHPDLPPATIRMEPDLEYQKHLGDALQSLRERMNAKIVWLIDEGHLDLDDYEQMQGATEEKTSASPSSAAVLDAG